MEPSGASWRKVLCVAVARTKAAEVAPASYVNSLKFGLTWGEKENRAAQRSDPDVSFAVHQDSRGKATRIAVFRANLLTGRTAHVE